MLPWASKPARAGADGAGRRAHRPGEAARRHVEEAHATAARVGYPVLVKASDGGGGKGMRLVRSEAELATALERTQSEAEKAFGSGEVYIEKAIEHARHVEVQVLGDRNGGGSCTSSSATARCSAGIRRSSRRRPAPRSRPRSAGRSVTWR